MSTVRDSAGAVARSVALGVAIIVVTSAALGWLYVLRSHQLTTPGPKVADALVLDELPGHAAVSLVLYLAVFAVAGLLLGATSRALRFDRLTAGLVLSIGTATWFYLASAFSIFVVRQVTFNQSLDSARSLEAVYLAATLCGLGGAILARRPRRGGAVVTLAVVGVAVVGILDLVGGVVPPRTHMHGAYGAIAPASTSALDRTVLIVSGVLLLLTSRALGRRSRPAWVATLLLVLVAVIARLVAGIFDAVTVIAILTALLLLARRNDFVAKADPARRPNALGRLVGMLLVAFLFGLAALVINRAAADLPVRLVPALRTTLFGFAGMKPTSAQLLTGGFADWYRWSVLAIVVFGIVWSADAFFAPWRARHHVDVRRWQLARAIVRASGIDSLAPFVLRADKALFLYPDEDGRALAADDTVLIAYRVVRGVAIVSGDPVGPMDKLDDALGAFLDHVSRRGWRVAIVGASDRCLATYRRLGLRALYHGDEAVIESSSFSLDGGKMKTVRQAAHRVARNGYTCEPLLAGEIDDEMRDELRALESAWLEYQPAKGFVMELDELFRLDGDDALFMLGRAPDGSIAGFLEFAILHAAGSLSLSSMPRRADAPNGLNAFLVTEAVCWAQAHEFDSLSLNFSPFARLLMGDEQLRFAQRVERRLLLVAKSLLCLQLDNLYRFNERLRPQWQARYLVFEHRRHLVRIAVAAMAAEYYLPFTAWLRGRDWTPAPERETILAPAPRAPAAVASSGSPPR